MFKKISRYLIVLELIGFLFCPGLLLAKTANDPLNGFQYYLDPIQAEAAWDYTTGSRSVVVAVIDTGVDIDHPDIYENIWRNIDEVPGDGIDNDHNGYIDDYQGWDFVNDEADPNPKFDSEYSELGLDHGTMVAGIIGARGNNNYGLTGINWEVSIMPLLALNGNGSGEMGVVAAAIDYAIANGADIINLSLVGEILDPSLQRTIKKAYDQGIVVVTASGNQTASSSGQDQSLDLDTTPRYPICFDARSNENYIFGVSSVDYQGKKSIFANYGEACVDISAPGENIFGLTVYQPTLANYREKFSGYWSGTSFATAIVSGAAALLKAYRPNLSVDGIYNLLLDNTDSLDQINSNYAGQLGSGELNLAKVLAAAALLPETGPASRIVAPQTGYAPRVEVYDDSGVLQTSWLAYNENFLGGVNLAVTDEAIITGAGSGGGPHVRVFDFSGQLQTEWFALDGQNTRGVKVAAWDNRVVVWSQDSSYPNVQIYSLDGQLLSQFRVGGRIYDLAPGNSDSDKPIEINILTKGKILVYSQLGVLERTVELATTAGRLAIANGQFVLAAHSGQASWIWIYDQAGNLQTSWLAYNENFLGGVNLAVTDEAIITGAGSGGGPHVRVFDFSGQLQTEWFALDSKFTQGINVGLVE